MASKKNNKTKQIAKQPEIVEKLDRWIFYGFLVILVMIPLAFARIFPYNAYITFDQFDVQKVLTLRILTAVIFGLWVWKMLVAREKEIRWSYPDFMVAGFVLLVFISTLTSIHMPTAIHGKFKRYEGLLTFINYGILYFLGLQTFTSLKRLSTLSTVFTFAGAIVALYGILQYFGLDPFQWSSLPFEERRSFSTFGNPDLLAGFLVILMPFTVVEFLKTKQIKDKVFAQLYDLLLLLICGISFLCILFAATRGAWIGAAFSLLILAVISFKSFIAHPVKSGIIIGAFVVVFASVAVWSASSGSGVLNLMERIKSATQITEGSAGSRLEIWKAGWKMIKNRPVLGAGPDTYRLSSEHFETARYVKDNQGKTVADNAHCYVIQLAAGVGVPATLIFLVFLAWIVFIALTRYRGLPAEEKITTAKIVGARGRNAQAGLQKTLDERLIVNGIVAAIMGYFVHLLFGVSITGGTGVFWVLIPAAIATSSIIKKTVVTGNSDLALKGAMTVTMVVVVMSAVFASTMFYADYCYATALSYSNTGNELVSSGDTDAGLESFRQSQLLYEKALSLYKNGRYYDGYGSFLENLGTSTKDESTIKKAIEVYAEGVKFEPLECDHYMYLAMAKIKRISSSNDPSVDDAISIIKKGIENRPLSPMAHMLLGNVYYIQGKNKEAIKELEFSLQFDPNNASALELLARTYSAIGNKKKAKALYEQVLLLDTERTSAKDALAQLNKEQ